MRLKPNVVAAMIQITRPRLRRLYEYWDGKRAGREMPARADLDPLDLTYILGNLSLIDVLGGAPERFRIRLHGTNLSERAGYDLTGKMVDELPEEQTQLRALLEEAYTRAVSTGDVLHAQRDRMVDHRHLCYESLIMPLSDDGNRVDRLIIGIIYDDEKD